MRISLNRALAAVCGVILIFGGGMVQAQQSPGRPQLGGARQETPRADVEFAGGTVAEYVAAIERAFGAANVAVQPGAESMRLAAVKLAGVRQQDALIVVTALADPENSRWLQVGSIGDPPITQIVSEAKSAGKPPELRVWTLDALVDGGARVEDILSAIEVAVALIPSDPQIKFHKDTGLLIMRAQVEQLDAANQVLRALELSQHQAADAAERRADEAAKKAAASN